MKALLNIVTVCIYVTFISCAGGGRSSENDHLATEGLSDRLNRSYGYEVDTQGNWVPRTDKRSQYEGRSESANFSGNIGKKPFQTNQINKSSWMRGQELERPSSHLNRANITMGGANRFNQQQALLDHRLHTPASIKGNHLATPGAYESSSTPIVKTGDTETDVRRRVFQQPDIIDYRQQRELSIQRSKKLLGRD